MRVFVTTVVVLLFTSVVSFADADLVLPLNEAATRFDEVVTFEAEVVSSPMSPRRQATYLNFGDAYPKQTMSVLFAGEHENILTNFPKLRGRTVRITGKVEKTKTGPVIRVTNAVQVMIVRANVVPVALDEQGDGYTFRRRFHAAVREQFNRGDYNTLETLARTWRRGNERFLDGHWKIQAFYDAISESDVSDEAEWKAVLDRLETWKTERLDDVTPYILKASLYEDLAWKARGGGFSHTVTDEGWRLFSERLELARNELEAIREQRFVCPQWHLAMLSIALGQGWSREHYDALYEEAMTNKPEYHFYSCNKAKYLQEKWYGKPGEWAAFAKSLVTRYPDGLGEILYAYVLWNVRPGMENLLDEQDLRFFGDTGAEWGLCQAGFERLRKDYPESMWILNNYALFAGKAGDRETLNRLLIELGDRCDMNVWVTWENVAYSRMWAADKLPPGVSVLGLFR